MRQNPQKNGHNPPAGIWGDCDRTAMSCLLELAVEEVPHWFDGGATTTKAAQIRDKWLSKLGLAVLAFPYPGEIPLAELLAQMGRLNGEAEYIFMGTSARGVNHVVCGRGDAIVWDPATGREHSITGPCDDGMWWILAISICRPTGKLDFRALAKSEAA